MANPETSSTNPSEAKQGCACPFCEVAGTEEKSPFCSPCETELSSCPDCKKPVRKDADKCPSCGASLTQK
jgi:Double zinc ribbon